MYKSNGNSKQTSDHFINGTKKANVCLSLLFKAILTHGIIPDVMLLGLVIQIPKIRENHSMTPITTEALH